MVAFESDRFSNCSHAKRSYRYSLSVKKPMSAAKASVAMPEDTIKATHAPIVWRTTDRLEASSAFEDEAT